MNLEITSFEKRGADYYIDLTCWAEPTRSLCIRVTPDMFRQIRSRLLSGRKPS